MTFLEPPNKYEALLNEDRYWHLINAEYIKLNAKNKSISLNQKYLFDKNAEYKLPPKIQLATLNTFDMWKNVIEDGVNKLLNCISNGEEETYFTYDDVYSHPQYGYANYELDRILDIIKEIMENKGYQIHFGGMSSGSHVTITKILEL